MKNRFPVQNIEGRGRCIVIPGNEFNPDWEADIEETCEDDEIDGQAVTLVMLGSKAEEEDGSGLEGSTRKPALREHPEPSKLWSDTEDKLLITIWNRQPRLKKAQVILEFRKKFPDRTSASVENHIGTLVEKDKIEPRWHSKKKRVKASKREKVEKKELTAIPTEIPTRIPTHAPIDAPVKEDPVVTLLREIRDLLAPRDFSFHYYCRTCGESGNVSNSERIWEFCPICGKPLLITNVEEFSS